LDHFHLRGGSSSNSDGAATDELTFYCAPGECRLKSFNEQAFVGGYEAADQLTSRPLSTELVVDIEDFDQWEVNPSSSPSNSTASSSGGCEVVTFGLKEFKAIIALSTPLSSSSHSHSHSNNNAPTLPLTCTYTTGGRPLLLSLGDCVGGGGGGGWEARFVVATTDYDSGGGGGSTGGSAGGSGKGKERAGSGSVKPEAASERGSAAPPSRARDPTDARAAAGPSNARGSGGRPLFNAPTPSPGPPAPRRAPQREEEEDEDGDLGGFDDGGEGMFDDMDSAFAEIDRLSQAHFASQAQAASQAQGGAQVLVRDTSEVQPSASLGEGAEEGLRSQLGPTQYGYAAAAAGSGGEGDGGDDGTPGEDKENARPAKRARWNLLGDD
ncbi:hypothetical protein JCM10207_009292, partial [Rhodosporidiobolus poonsookiae]